MTPIGIGQLRGHTRDYLARVATGEAFEVLRRGRPIARLQAAHGLPATVSTVLPRDLRARAGALVDRVQAGETIVVQDRGRPVAALRPWVGQPPGKPSRVPTMRQHGAPV